MKIEQVISRNYESLRKYIKGLDKPVYCGFTPEDIFHECLIYSMRKFKDIELNEAEALKSLKKLIGTEIKYSYRRKKKDLLVLVEDSDKQV